MNKIETFEKMLANGNDNALLRYSLGNEYAQGKDYDKALEHLRQAVALKPDYSAAWKLFARTLMDSGDKQAAVEAYEQGIEVAESNGDVQAAKEMKVFLKRLQK